MIKRTFLLLTLVFFVCELSAQVRLPVVFGDHMVLQRDKPIVVWGWSSPGEKVTVQFGKQSKRVTATRDGKWKVALDPVPAGGPHQLIVKGKNTVTIKDVLVGEVWLSSGQSNMQWIVKNSMDAEKEIAAGDYPRIRHIRIPQTIAATPADDVKPTSWQICSPETVANFTAVGYFFGRELLKEVDVPIGLINSSWGGTHVETWTSREALMSHDEFKSVMANVGKIDLDSAQKAQKDPSKPVSPNAFPTLLFNGMINPLIPYTIRGAIWYQGESNASRAYQYRESFPLMINDWRKRWGLGDFPFYFVQLSSYNQNNGDSNNGSTWAELREAQTLTLSLPNTGMAVTVDIGDRNDVHPRNKQEVGRRLAALALDDIYGKDIVSSGPVYKSMKKEGDKIVVSFTDIGAGLTVKDKYGYLRGFEIAGADKKFYYAQAHIEGNTVVVYHKDVKDPVAVRYGWADDAGDCNLFNKEGFPAVPFRSDDWTGITVDKKFNVVRPVQ
jgi:sialate O-acetylesterase